MKTLEMIRRFLLYTAKAVCFEQFSPLDVHQYAFGRKLSNLNLPDAVSGWLSAEVGAGRFGLCQEVQTANAELQTKPVSNEDGCIKRRLKNKARNGSSLMVCVL